MVIGMGMEEQWVTCGTCAGGGSHYDYSSGESRTCYSCNGRGTTVTTVWVDPPAPIGGFSGNKSHAEDKSKIETLLAGLISVAVFFTLFAYIDENADSEPIWSFAIAGVVAAISMHFLTGPLRPLVTVLKWLIGIAIVVYVFSLFQTQ